MARKLPTGIQDFEKLREMGFLYVDKTSYVYKLVQNETPYFLSRPRRFGKSLLLSTLRAYWEGKKELFAGLDIARQMEEDGRMDAWRPFPVFYFDFNKKNYQRGAALEEILEDHLQGWEGIYGDAHKNAPLEERFQHLLVMASEQTGRRCVVLVDEYDKPLLDILENEPAVSRNKDVFNGFFSALKSHDRYLQFVFITGVSKFSKVSIFSDINQLEDISFDEEYAGICGITEEELRAVFCPEIENMASSRSLSVGQCLEKLKETYDGYRFSPEPLFVYNPYSLLNALKKRKFGSYWFESGTPTFLVNRLKDLHFDVRQFSKKSIFANEKMLSDYRVENPDPVPLLYQTGYLAIIDYGEKDEVYTLGFPNREVEDGFLESLMPAYVEDCGAGSGKDILSLRRFLEDGDLDGIKNVLTALFASIPYTTNEPPFEHYFQTVLYIVFTLLGKYTICELHTFLGRVDCVVETQEYVYLFEFKRDDSAEAALRQIEDRGYALRYALPYAADSRTVIRIGVSFDSAERMPVEWKVV